MRRALLCMLGIMMIATGCSLNYNENAVEEMSYRAAGLDGPRSLQQGIEERVEVIPGVEDAHVLLDEPENLIIALETDDVTQYSVIEGNIKQELQGEAKHYLIYLVGDNHPDLRDRIESASLRMNQGERMRPDEMQNLLRSVWKNIPPFNFLSKS